MGRQCDRSCYKWKDSVTPCQIISHDGDRGKFDCIVFYSAGARGQSDFDIFGCANECVTIGLSVPAVCLIRNISPLAETRPPAAIRAAASLPGAPPAVRVREGPSVKPIGLCNKASAFKPMPPPPPSARPPPLLSRRCLHIQHLFPGRARHQDYNVICVKDAAINLSPGMGN